MADYKRMVSYMYQYENGVKRKNVGYARIEAKNGQCKITLHMQLLGQLDSIFPTYLIQRGKNDMELIYLGDTLLKNQVMDSKLVANESNIMDSGYGLSEMGGLLLFLNDNVFFATEWDDKPIIAKEVLDALKPKASSKEKKPEGKPIPVILKRGDKSETTDKSENTERSVEYEDEIELARSEEDTNQEDLYSQGSLDEDEVSDELYQESSSVNQGVYEADKSSDDINITQDQSITEQLSLQEELLIPKYRLPRGWKTIERLNNPAAIETLKRIDIIKEYNPYDNQTNTEKSYPYEKKSDYIREDLDEEGYGQEDTSQEDYEDETSNQDEYNQEDYEYEDSVQDEYDQESYEDEDASQGEYDQEGYEDEDLSEEDNSSESYENEVLSQEVNSLESYEKKVLSRENYDQEDLSQKVNNQENIDENYAQDIQQEYDLYIKQELQQDIEQDLLEKVMKELQVEKQVAADFQSYIQEVADNSEKVNNTYVFSTEKSYQGEYTDQIMSNNSEEANKVSFYNMQFNDAEENFTDENYTEGNYAEVNAAALNTAQEDITLTKEDMEDEPDHPSAKHFFDHYPRIYPFEDNEIVLCVKIEPKDIGLLPKETWVLSNNSFLMHGFYCYHHLIFAKMKDRYGCRYILGIPGIFHNRERFMARMFGFESFKSIRKRDLRQGDFGYWYISITF